MSHQGVGEGAGGGGGGGVNAPWKLRNGKNCNIYDLQEILQVVDYQRVMVFVRTNFAPTLGHNGNYMKAICVTCYNSPASTTHANTSFYKSSSLPFACQLSMLMNGDFSAMHASLPASLSRPLLAYDILHAKFHSGH